MNTAHTAQASREKRLTAFLAPTRKAIMEAIDAYGIAGGKVEDKNATEDRLTKEFMQIMREVQSHAHFAGKQKEAIAEKLINHVTSRYELELGTEVYDDESELTFKRKEVAGRFISAEFEKAVSEEERKRYHREGLLKESISSERLKLMYPEAYFGSRPITDPNARRVSLHGLSVGHQYDADTNHYGNVDLETASTKELGKHYVVMRNREADAKEALEAMREYLGTTLPVGDHPVPGSTKESISIDTVRSSFSEKGFKDWSKNLSTDELNKIKKDTSVLKVDPTKLKKAHPEIHQQFSSGGYSKVDIVN